MEWQYNPYSVLLLLSAVTTTFVAGVAWRRRRTLRVMPLFVLMVAQSVWAISAAMRGFSIELEAMRFWLGVAYAGAVVVPAAFLAFALDLSGFHDWLTTRTLLTLAIEPVVALALEWTNPWHHLFWPVTEVQRDGARLILHFTYGPLFWINVAYSWFLVALGIGLLAQAAARAARPQRGQPTIALLGAIVPMATSVMDSLGMTPGHNVTPLAFSVSGLVFAYGLLRHQLLDLVPIAREAIIENMADGVLVLDPVNRVVDVNPAALRFFGTNARALIGKPAEEILAPWADHRDRLRAVQEVREEIFLGGTLQRYYDLRISPISDRRGRLRGRLIVTRNVTERKQAERLRDDLLHTMVHDLRGPLTSIVASLQVLLEDGQSGLPAAERTMMLDIADRNAQRLLALTDSILEINRLELGEVRLNRESTRLAEVIDEICRLQAPTAAQNGLRLENATLGDVPPVLLDRALILRVLENLIGNSLKFSPTGSVIRVVASDARVATSDPMDGFVCVTVSDQGPGIAPELRQRLFQKFATGEVPGRGSGLGLAFCRLIVEAHGGRIWLEPDAPGAVFRFTLPAD